MLEPPLPIILATCLLATVTLALPSETISTRALGSNRLNVSPIRCSARRAIPLFSPPPLPPLDEASWTGTMTFSSPNVYISYSGTPASKSRTSMTGRARSCSVMPEGTFTRSSSSYAFCISPSFTNTTVSSTLGMIPSSILPMNRWTASSGALAWTTPTIPTPVSLRSENTAKSSTRRTSSNMV